VNIYPGPLQFRFSLLVLSSHYVLTGIPLGEYLPPGLLQIQILFTGPLHLVMLLTVLFRLIFFRLIFSSLARSHPPQPSSEKLFLYI
jgi:hypothetical protein